MEHKITANKTCLKSMALKYATYLEETNKAICAEINTESSQAPELIKSIGLSRGKQLRPLFIYSFADAFGGSQHHSVLLAATVESIHIASLIHDDVIDKCDIRRQRATMNKLFGNNQAVLLGDLVFTAIFRHASQLRNWQLIDQCSNTIDTLVNGELLQQQLSGDLTVSFEAYRNVLAHKTGALLELCSSAAANIANAPEEATLLAGQFGLQYGIAFQMVDDWADFYLSDQDGNKDRGIDIANGFITLPWLILLQHAPEEDKQQLIDIMQSGQATGLSNPFIAKMAADIKLNERVDTVLSQELNAVREIVEKLAKYMPTNETNAFIDQLYFSYQKVSEGQ